MADSFTNNYNLVLQVTGSNSGIWGADVNNNMISPTDLILGGTQAITMTSSNVTLTLTQWQNKAFKITGALTANLQLILPLSPNSVGNATGVGGEFIVDNETTNTGGPWTITVLTAATSSTGVTVSQGRRTVLYSDTVNVWYADDARTLKAKYSATPSVSLAGQAGTVNTDVDLAWDGSALYACTTAGAAGSAVYSKITGVFTAPQGYLTPVSGQPIITSDSIGASTIYYTPYVGNLIPIMTAGGTVSLVTFSETAIALAAGSQSSNGLFDVYAFLNSGVLTFAFSPNWSGGTGGNITAGSCARGTGAGGTAIQRINGLWVNTVQQTVNNGASSFTMPAQQGTYLGTIYVDATAGQVTCHRTWGQNRKFGIWNAYNRVPVTLQAGDSTANWNYGTNTVRASNATPASWSSTEYNVGSGTACNGMTMLNGLAEEKITAEFMQSANSNATGEAIWQIGVGINSTTAFTGTAPTNATSTVNIQLNSVGRADVSPALGITTVQALENYTPGTTNAKFYGTQAQMTLTAQWRA